MASFTSVQNGNWADGATWGNTSPGVKGTDFPGDQDTASIYHDVTFDEGVNTTDEYGNVSIYSGGVFIFPTNANSTMQFYGSAYIQVGGELRIGTSSTPVDAAYEVKIVQGSSAVATGERIIVYEPGQLNMYGDNSLYGNLVSAYLEVEWSTGNTFYVGGDYETTWQAGLILYVPTNTNSGSEYAHPYTIQSVGTYDMDNNRTPITVTAANPVETHYVSFVGTTAHPVVVLSRNIILQGEIGTFDVGDYSSITGTGEAMVLNSNSSENTIYIDNVMFVGFAGGITNTYNPTITNCSFVNVDHIYTGYNYYGLTFNNCIFASFNFICTDSGLTVGDDYQFLNCTFMCGVSGITGTEGTVIGHFLQYCTFYGIDNWACYYLESVTLDTVNFYYCGGSHGALYYCDDCTHTGIVYCGIYAHSCDNLDGTSNISGYGTILVSCTNSEVTIVFQLVGSSLTLMNACTDCVMTLPDYQTVNIGCITCDGCTLLVDYLTVVAALFDSGSFNTIDAEVTGSGGSTAGLLNGSGHKFSGKLDSMDKALSGGADHSVVNVSFVSNNYCIYDSDVKIPGAVLSGNTNVAYVTQSDTSRGCIILENLDDGDIRPIMRYTNRGTVLSLVSGDINYQTPPSGEDWVLEMAMNAALDRRITGLINRLSVYDYATPPFAHVGAGAFTFTFKVYPIGWTTALTNKDLKLEIFYLNAASGHTRSLALNGTGTYSNGAWRDVTVSFETLQEGLIYFNLWMGRGEASASLLVDPIWSIE